MAKEKILSVLLALIVAPLPMALVFLSMGIFAGDFVELWVVPGFVITLYVFSKVPFLVAELFCVLRPGDFRSS